MYNFKMLQYYLKSDLYGYYGKYSLYLMAKELIIGIGYKYSFWMRIAGYLRDKKGILWMPGIMSRLMLRRYMFKFGVSIPSSTKIGPGFYIGHFGGIVIHADVVIGKNCNISQGVTIGIAPRGKRQGVPVIGDNVYIGPGAKIFGKIRIGNNVAIGANCVVTKDIPDNAVVVGIPASIKSYNGSAGYVNNGDYESLFSFKKVCESTQK
jgi:serine O-acetyltransferase